MRHPGIDRWYFFFMQFLSILSQFGKGKLHIFVTCVGSMYTIYLNLHLNHDSIAETVILNSLKSASIILHIPRKNCLQKLINMTKKKEN